MLHALPFGETTLNYSLNQTRRSRRMRISIDADASITVRAQPPMSQRYIEGVLVARQGWILKTIEIIRRRGVVIRIAHDPAAYKKYKKTALEFVCKKIEEFNRAGEFSFSTISIRNQRKRWGSCSKNGNIIFNYKLLFLPDELSAYVVVHELCHLKQHNHSRAFWQEVGRKIPDYRERIAALRKFII